MCELGIYIVTLIEITMIINNTLYKGMVKNINNRITHNIGQE